MGNSSTIILPTDYSCFDANLSRNSVTPEYWDSFSISDDFRNGSLAIAIITLLMLLVGLPSNFVIIVSILQQKLYKESAHILLLNLAVSDFLLCLLVMPAVIVSGFAGSYIFGDSDYVRCQVCQTGLILISLTLVSVYLLCLLSVDRLMFIRFPLRYNRYVTKRRVIVIVAFAWTLSIAIALVPLSGIGEIRYSFATSTCIIIFIGRSENLYYAIFLVGHALVPITITVGAYIWIACFVSKEIKEIYRMRKSLYKNQQVLAETMQKERQRKKNMKRFRLITVFGTIVIVNFIVWTPIVIETILSATVESQTVPLGTQILTYLCILLHSVLHPLIEGCFIPEIKVVFKKILGIKTKAEKSSGENMQSTR